MTLTVSDLTTKDISGWKVKSAAFDLSGGQNNNLLPATASLAILPSQEYCTKLGLFWAVKNFETYYRDGRSHKSSFNSSMQNPAITPLFSASVHGGVIPARFETYKLPDGTEVISQLPKEIADSVDILKAPATYMTPFTFFVGGNYPHKPTRPINYNIFNSVSFLGLNTDKDAWVESTINSIDIKYSLMYLKTFKKMFEAHPSKSMTVLRVKSLYRGKGEPPTCVETQTKKQILGGGRFFGLVLQVPTWDHALSKPVVKSIFTLASFDSLQKINKHVKSASWAQDFIIGLQMNPTKYFDPVAYQTQMDKISGQYTKWWGGISKIISTAQVDENAQTEDLVKQVLEGDHITGSYFSVSRKKKEIENSKTKKKMDKVTGSIRNYEDSIKSLDADLSSKNRYIHAAKALQEKLRAKIVDFQDEIDAKLTEIQLVNKQITEFDERKVEIIKNKSTFDKALAKLTIEMDALIGSIDTTANYNKLYENLLTQGVVIHKLWYQDSLGLQHLVTNASDLVRGQLVRVSFATTKPSEIAIDIDQHKPGQAPIVCAGPYYIQVNANAGKPRAAIRLASSDAVFGYEYKGNTVMAQIHPHTKESTIWGDVESYNKFVNSHHTICLGEAETTIAKAFQHNDISLIVGAILGWVRNSNSKDAWGKYWVRFPKPVDVNLHLPAPRPPIKVAPTPAVDVSQLLSL